MHLVLLGIGIETLQVHIQPSHQLALMLHIREVQSLFLGHKAATDWVAVGISRL
jgi:hypothetical protein